MSRAVKPLLKHSIRCPYSLPLRLLCTKETPQKSKDSSTNLFRDIVESNEVKLVRLASTKIMEESKILFRAHVLENPSFKASVQTMKTKFEQLQTQMGAAAKTIEKEMKSAKEKADAAAKGKN